MSRHATRRIPGICTFAAALLSLLGGVASADSTPAADFDLRLSSERPDTLTGASIHVLYRDPSDPDAKPSPLTKVVIEAPAGTRFDGTAVLSCQATDDELMARGRDACPSDSRVGGGSLTAMTGFGPPVDPYATDVTLFNSGDGIIELVTQKGTNQVLGIDRTKFTGPSTLTAHPPATPGGPPDGKTSVRELFFTYDAVRGPTGKRFITTPPDCPARGLWSSRLLFSTADGNSYRVGSTTTCLRPKGASPRPRLRLSVTPRRVVAGRRVRFRVRVRSSDPSCARAATVRFAGRRLRTNRRGRGRLTLRMHRLGLRRLVASKPGCRRDSALVAVRRRR
jgi:hypothetical protein